MSLYQPPLSFQAARGNTATKLMWDEMSFSNNVDEHMAALMGMKQMANSIFQMFCSHRLNKLQLDQSRQQRFALQRSTNVEDMTSEERALCLLEERRRAQLVAAAKLGLNTTGRASAQQQWLDMESKRHSKVRYLNVSFVCKAHSAAILEDGAGTNKCIDNYMGQPFHLRVDPEFRNLSEHFATNNKNVLLAEMGIIPNVDRSKLSDDVDLSIGKLASTRGLTTLSNELFPLADHINNTINSPVIIERKLYIYTDTAPKDISKNAICIVTKMESAPGYFIIVAADQFDAGEVDTECMSPARAIAMRLITLLVMITRHYSAYFDEAVVAVEANSFKLDFFKQQFDTLFYSNPYLVKSLGVEFVVHALSKAQMIKYQADDNRHFKEASKIQMRKECQRANREYERVMKESRSKTSQYNSNKYRRQLTARRTDDSDGEYTPNSEYSSSSSGDENSDDDDMKQARKLAGRKLTKRRNKFFNGMLKKLNRQCNDGGETAANMPYVRQNTTKSADRDIASILESDQVAEKQRITYNLGYLLQGEKVCVYLTFFGQVLNQGLIRCADSVLTVSMRSPYVSVPYEISRQLAHVRIDKNRVTGKSTGQPDDMSVCTCMAWYIAARSSSNKCPMTVRLRPTHKLIEKFKLQDASMNLDLRGCYSVNRSAVTSQTSFVLDTHI